MSALQAKCASLPIPDTVYKWMSRVMMMSSGVLILVAAIIDMATHYAGSRVIGDIVLMLLGLVLILVEVCQPPIIVHQFKVLGNYAGRAFVFLLLGSWILMIGSFSNPTIRQLPVSGNSTSTHDKASDYYVQFENGGMALATGIILLIFSFFFRSEEHT